MALDRTYFNSIKLDPVKRKYYDIYAVDNLLVDIRRQAELMNRRYEELRNEIETAGAGQEELRKKGQILSEEILALREKLQKAELAAAESETKLAEAEKKAAEAGQKAADAEQRAAEAEEKTSAAEQMRLAAEQKAEAVERKAEEAQKAASAAEKRASEAEQERLEAEEKAAVRVGEPEEQPRSAENAGTMLYPAEKEEQRVTCSPEIMEDMYRSMKKIYTSGLQTLEEQWQEFLENSRTELPSDLRSKISRIASALEEINGSL